MLSFSSVYFFKLSGIECGPVIVIDSELQNLSLSFTVSKGWIISAAAAAAAKSLQSCPTLCDPIDGSPPGSPVPEILQARTLECVAMSFSNAWKWKVKGKSLSRVRLFATPWTAAHQASPSIQFSRQEYWSGVPLLTVGIINAIPLGAKGKHVQWPTIKDAGSLSSGFLPCNATHSLCRLSSGCVHTALRELGLKNLHEKCQYSALLLL